MTRWRLVHFACADLLGLCMKEDARVDFKPRWANAFARLDDSWINQISHPVPRLGLHGLASRGWRQSLEHDYCYHLDVGEKELWLEEFEDGWEIELLAVDQETVVLTFSLLAELPILCPTLCSAAQLAEAWGRNPTPRHDVFWRSAR
jgi:hypothetical protein